MEGAFRENFSKEVTFSGGFKDLEKGKQEVGYECCNQKCEQCKSLNRNWLRMLTQSVAQ